jgi:hypothetical protein
MNKASSKLAAGVRKVKAQQTPAPAAPKPVRSKAADHVEPPVVKPDRSGHGTAMHPTRVWPD